MLAVKEAKQLIESADVAGIDEVYAFNIPDEIVGNPDKTIIRITDVSTQPDLWASNDFDVLNRRIEVQIFYKQNLTVDPEQTETELYRLFVHNGWDLGDNHGHTIDPDTNQLMTTFYVNNSKLI